MDETTLATEGTICAGWRCVMMTVASGYTANRGAQTHEMHRRLEQPARRSHAAGLEELKETPMPAQVAFLVGADKPLVVIGQVGLGHELEAREVERRDGDALLGRGRRHVVLLSKVRNEAEDPLELRADRVDPFVVAVVLRARGRMRQQAFPRQGRPVVAIQVQQRVQDGRPGPLACR